MSLTFFFIVSITLILRRRHTEWKRVIKVFIFFTLLRIPDLLSTYYFVKVKNYGVDAEMNILCKYFMVHFGIIGGLILSFIVLLPAIFILAWAFYDTKFVWVYLFIHIIVPLHNLEVINMFSYIEAFTTTTSRVIAGIALLLLIIYYYIHREKLNYKMTITHYEVTSK